MSGYMQVLSVTEPTLRCPSPVQEKPRAVVAESSEQAARIIEIDSLSPQSNESLVQRGLDGNAFFSNILPDSVAIEDGLGEPFQFLLVNLDSVKELYNQIDNRWFESPEEEKIKSGLIEAAKIVCDFVKQIELGFEASEDEQGNSINAEEAEKNFAAQIAHRIQQLGETVKSLTDTDSKPFVTPSTDKKLNLLTLIINGLFGACGLPPIAGSVSTIAISSVRGIMDMFSDRREENIKIAENIKDIIIPLNQFLSEERDMYGVPRTATNVDNKTFNQASEGLKSELQALQKQNQELSTKFDKFDQFVDKAGPLLDQLNGHSRRHSTDAILTPVNLEASPPARPASVDPEDQLVSRKEVEAMVQEAAKRAAQETITMLLNQGLLKIG